LLDHQKGVDGCCVNRLLFAGAAVVRAGPITEIARIRNDQINATRVT
jgi:hypothetical protein